MKGDNMIHITVNLNELLAVPCWLGLICWIGTIVTDKTNEEADFLHYVLMIAEMLLWIGVIFGVGLLT